MTRWPQIFYELVRKDAAKPFAENSNLKLLVLRGRLEEGGLQRAEIEELLEEGGMRGGMSVEGGDDSFRSLK